MKKHLIAAAIGIAFTGLAATTALAQSAASSYPSRPITIIVASGAGGSSDIETRYYAEKLSKVFGQPVIVENKAGAGGTVGNTFVASAPPDGYTLLTTSPTITITPAIRKNAPFHPIKNFEPISLMSRSPTMLVVRNDLPVNSAAEYIDYARKNPDKISFGAAGGIGGYIHLSGEWLHSATKTKAAFVGYQGGPQAMVDLMAGRLDATISSINFLTPYIREKKVKALAVASLQRVAVFPEIPTISELGIVPKFDSNFWLGYLAPKGTPPEIIQKLNAEFVKIAKLPETAERLAANTQTAVGSTVEEFRQVIADEVDRWAKIATEANVKLD